MGFPTSNPASGSSGDAILNLTTGTGGPPPGEYLVKFMGAEATNHETWGAGCMFRAEVCEGEHAGKETKRTGKPTPTSRNSTGKLLAGLLGRQFSSGESINIGQFIGKKFKALVTEHGDGTRLESLYRIPEETY